MVWLDLKNAFGSVPHNTMWEMMSRLPIYHGVQRDLFRLGPKDQKQRGFHKSNSSLQLLTVALSVILMWRCLTMVVATCYHDCYPDI